MLDWDPEDIKAAVRKTGFSLAEIGRRIGRDRRLMAKALRFPDRLAEREIAKTIGVPASLIWPSRYYPAGHRKAPQPSANYRGLPARQARGVAS